MVGGVGDSGVVWVLIGVIGVGTFGIRFSFLPVIERVVLPSVIQTGLGLIPVAILATLVVPGVLVLDGGVGGVGVARVVAGGVAGVVAWRTENMVATVSVGMGVLWGGQLLLG